MTREGRAVLDELRVRGGLDPRLPWGGRSPRVLTRAYAQFILRREVAPLDEFFDEEVLDEQYRRFLGNEGEGG